MKSTSILMGVLASIGAAQPHAGHHHVHRQPVADDAIAKRALTTEWQTEWQTVSVTTFIGQDNAEFRHHYSPPDPSPSASSTPVANVDPATDPFGQSSSSPAVVEQPLSTSTSTTSIPAAVVTTETTHAPAAAVLSPPPAPTTLVSSTTSLPASGSSSGSGSSTPATCTGGDLTFYQLGLGSCGFTNTDQSAPVVALPVSFMQAGYNGNPNNNPMCGKKIAITANGVTQIATVVDSCGDCANSCSVDASLGFFQLFAPESVGRITGISWSWV